MRLLTAIILPMLTIASAHAQPATPMPAMPADAALVESIRAADSAMFALVFEGCDPDKLRPMLSDNLEFYHDKAGVTARSAKEFIDQYVISCEARKAPDAFRARRALVPESLHVDPVPGFGAMQVGEHLFYERKGDGPEKLAGKAGFAMVWQWDMAAWKLHRVLSFGHMPAE